MAQKDEAIKTAAQRIRNAWRTGRPCRPVRDQVGPKNLDGAYAVQQINTDLWVKDGRRISGRKLGLTAKTVQKQLGVDQPDYGILYADMEVVDGDEIATDRLMHAFWML